MLTSNDVVILTLTPVIYHFSRATGIDPAPLLFLEFFTANVWSMALLIGERMLNPTLCPTHGAGPRWGRCIVLLDASVWSMAVPSLRAAGMVAKKRPLALSDGVHSCPERATSCIRSFKFSLFAAKQM